MLSEKVKSFWKLIPFVWKTILLYVPLFAAVFTFFLFLALFEIKESSIEHTKADILAKIEQLQADDLNSEDFSLIAGDYQVVIFNSMAQPLMQLNYFIEENPLQNLNEFQIFEKGKIILYNTPLKMFNEEYIVQIAKNRYIEDEIISNLKDFFFLIILAGLLISATLSIPLTRLSLREIENMAKAAETISYENLETRLEISGSGDEFDTLATTLNQMIDRIQTSAIAQKKFISNASHELRTPIAVIKGYAQLLTRWGTENQEILKESATAINKEVEAIQILLQDLLLLTRIDSQLTDLKVEQIDLLPLIDESIKENKMLYPSREFSLYKDDHEPYEILCDQWLIKGLFRIFTENGVKYSPDDSPIGYSITKDDNIINIFIVDHGYGIPDEEKDKIFERFYRVDEARTREKGGAGLGLAIAKRVIELHKGNVAILDTPNGGTTIKLSFPAYIPPIDEPPKESKGKDPK